MTSTLLILLATLSSPSSTSSSWTVGIVAIAPADLVGARDLMLEAIRERPAANVRVVVLVAEGDTTRLLEVPGDGAITEVPFPGADVRKESTLTAFGQHLAQGSGGLTAVVFWGHGRGWRGFGGGARNRGTGGRGWPLVDGTFDRAVRALREGLGRRIDILGFDACLMGAWEVASAMSPFASILVASPELVPVSGWPLGDLLEALGNDLDSSPPELAAAIVARYGSVSRRHAALTAVDLRQMPAVDGALEALAREALQSKCSFDSAWLDTLLAYRAEGAVDVGALASEIARHGCTARVRRRAAQLAPLLKEAIVSRSCRTAYCEGVGVSIHARHSVLDASYSSPLAAWNKMPSWSRWISSSIASHTHERSSSNAP